MPLPLQQHVGAGHPGVEVTHSRLELIGWFESLGQILDVLCLLLGGEVLDGVDELRAADLGDGHGCERQHLELGPERGDPHDVTIYEP